MTFFKTFLAAFLALLVFSALSALVTSISQNRNEWRQINADLEKALGSPSPSPGASRPERVRLNRDISVDTTTGSVRIAEGTWLLVQGESERAFTCYHNGQPIQVSKWDAQIVTWTRTDK